MRDLFDYAIVGAGPAGLAVAIHAARAGRRAVVVERRAGPLDQACGEGLMPPGVAWLARLGVAVPPDDSRPFLGVRYIDGDIAAEADFAEGPGLAVRRTALSRALLERATALGAEVRPGCAARAITHRDDHVVLDTAEGPIAATWLVGADGVHGRVRSACGVKVHPARLRRFGMRRHFRAVPWSDHVEVHWSDGAEAYVTPVGPERVGVALLWTCRDDRDTGGEAGRGYDDLLSRFPALRERLGAATDTPETSVRGAGPFGTSARLPARGRVLLVGDAAGSLDAVTGEGLSVAFASAAALVEATTGPLAGSGASPAAAAAAYARAWRRLRRRQAALNRLVLRLAERRAVRRRVIRVLRDRPETFRAFLALATGAWGWRRALPDLSALGLRLLAP